MGRGYAEGSANDLDTAAANNSGRRRRGGVGGEIAEACNRTPALLAGLCLGRLLFKATALVIGLVLIAALWFWDASC